jgi:hypothetical protein
MLTGCGGDSHRATVEGRITIDHAALENGTISFSPTDGNNGPTAGANIKDGCYSIDAAKGPATGWNRITISGAKKTGKRISDPMMPGRIVDEVVSVVPERYNSQSTLKQELKPGKNVLDFDLLSK